MDSAAKESILPDRLSERLGGLILKDEQRLAVEALMSGKDVLAVLPTGFGKSVIYQSFVIAKDSSSIVVIVPLRSIIDDQLQSNDFGLKAVAFEKKPELMKDIHRIHKWRTRGKKLVPSHQSEALEDKQKLQMKTFSETCRVFSTDST